MDRLGECYFRHAQICGILQANLHVMYRQQCHIAALTPASTAPSTHHTRTHTHTHTHARTRTHTYTLTHTHTHTHTPSATFLRLQLLDVGRNRLHQWEALGPLQHMSRLSNLNLQGNRVCSVEGYTAKVQYVHACTWNLLCVSVCCIHHTLAGTLVCSVWLHTLH